MNKIVEFFLALFQPSSVESVVASLNRTVTKLNDVQAQHERRIDKSNDKIQKALAAKSASQDQVKQAAVVAQNIRALLGNG